MAVHTAFISLGSNLGDKLKNIQEAVTLLTEPGISTLIRHSGFYKTEPEDYEDQEWFVNTVVEIETVHPPLRLLNSMKSIEKKLGREDTGVRFGPRIIDLDILFFNDMVIREEDLVIPHPRLHLRRFVLKPICDIAPHFIHPVLEKDMDTLLGELKSEMEVILIDK